MPGVRADIISDGPAPGVYAEPPETIFTGRLDKTGEKRAEKLIEWWPQVIKAVPGARLTLVGGGSALPQLRAGVAARGLGGVVSLPGPLPHSLLLQRLRSAGLYVFPSRFETFGIAPLEAMAAGLPVVASDLPALRESLGDDALLLPVEDDALWIRTIVSLLQEREARLKLAERGPVRARRFTWARQAEAYEAHLVAAASISSRSSGPGRTDL